MNDDLMNEHTFEAIIVFCLDPIAHLQEMKHIIIDRIW